jgi:DNA-binding NtrC family response regulator
MDRLQGDDLTVQRMLEQVRLAGQLREPVWLEGEPGTGKRFVSRVIHYCGVTSEQPYVTVDVPRLPFEAAAELLFGEHGLGRPERVGTIYVREPARLPRELQEMLAEFLADRPPNGPRVIAGSSKDPGDELTAGRLLPSLFYRLSIQRILLQPLRSRVAELPRLLSAAIERHGVAGQPSVLGPEIVEILARYTWPGNYRELEEVAASLVRAASGAKIEVAHIPQHVRRSVEAPEIPRTASPALDLNTVLRQIESKLVLRALRACKGNKTKAAEMLGIPRLGLLSRMKTLGVRDE